MTVAATLRIPRFLHYRTDERVAIEDPEDISTDESDPARLLSETNGASATCFAYAVERSEGLRLRDDAAAAATTLALNGFKKLRVGDVLEIEVDTPGDVSENTVQAIDPDTGAVVVSPGLTDDARAGKRVRVRLGEYAMAGFGTPAQGSDAWGFEVIVPAAIDVEPGDFVRLEVDFSGAAGGGLDRRFPMVPEVTEEEV